MISNPLVLGNIFETPLFRDAFEDLFKRGQEDSILDDGIITYVLKNHSITPAKGGSTESLREWSDTTYFSHVINGMAIAGRLLEHKIKKIEMGTVNKGETEQYIRLFFASVALHDADKLFGEGYSGAMRLDEVLEKHKQDIIKVCSYYLRELGDAKNWWDDLSYLILRTENRTMELANGLNTTMEKTLLSSISDFVKLADQSGGIKAHDSNGIFFEMKKLLMKYNEEINILRFSHMPQSLLMAKLLASARSNINKSRIIAETPNGIIYSGPELTEEETSGIKDHFISSVGNLTKETVENIILSYAPSNNSIRLDFAKEIPPSLENVEIYVEKFSGKLLLWSGKEWKTAHSDFDIKARKFGVPLSSKKIGQDITFFLELPEKSEELGDTEIMRKRLLGLMACAQRVYYQCLDNKLPESPAEMDFLIRNFGEEYKSDEGDNGKSGYADMIQMKTLLAISYASMFHNLSYDELKEKYQETLKSVADELKKIFPSQHSPDYSRFFDNSMGLFDISKVPDKSETCIQCGNTGDFPLKDQYAFGYKATAGSGLKISVLKYDENKFNGKICLMCAKENSIRKSEIGRETGALCVRINIADYVVPLNLDRLVESFGKSSNDGKGYTIEYGASGESALIILNKRTKKQLDYHTVMFVSRPKKTKDEFYMIYGILGLIAKRGLKIKITPLFSSEDLFVPMFTWENSPYWVRNLEMSEIRIDKVQDARKLLVLIYSVSKLNFGYEGVLNFIIENMTRSKRGFFYAAWRNILSEGSDKILVKISSVKKGVNWYMEKYRNEVGTVEMQEIVNEACGIASSGPKSGNDHTWMIRTALDAYGRNIRKEDKEIKDIIAGRIWEIARRDKYVKNDARDHCGQFSKLFVDMLRGQFKKMIPAYEYRKDIIAQFAIMYNITKWNSLKKNGGDEKNE